MKKKEFEEGKQPGPQNQLLNFHFSVSIKSEKRFPEPFISSFTCTFHSLMEEGLLQRLERYFFFFFFSLSHHSEFFRVARSLALTLISVAIAVPISLNAIFDCTHRRRSRRGWRRPWSWKR